MCNLTTVKSINIIISDYFTSSLYILFFYYSQMLSQCIYLKCFASACFLPFFLCKKTIEQSTSLEKCIERRIISTILHFFFISLAISPSNKNNNQLNYVTVMRFDKTNGVIDYLLQRFLLFFFYISFLFEFIIIKPNLFDENMCKQNKVIGQKTQ